MLAQIDESIYDPKRCVEEQKAFASSVKEIYLEIIPQIRKELSDIKTELTYVDEKHTKAIENLQKNFGDKLDHVVSMNAEQNTDLQDIKKTLSGIAPYLKYVTPISETWHRWRPRIIWVGVASFLWVIVSILNPSLSPASLHLLFKVLG